MQNVAGWRTDDVGRFEQIDLGIGGAQLVGRSAAVVAVLRRSKRRRRAREESVRLA